MQQLIEQKQRNIFFFILMLVLLMLFFVQLLDFGRSNPSNNGRTNLPVSIRADSQADYGQDSDDLIVPPVNENIIQQIIQDLQGIGDPAERVSTLQASFSMPVPTMTWNPLIPTSTLPPTTNSVGGSTTPQATVSLPVTATDTILTASPTPSPITTIVSSTPPVKVPTSAPPATRKPKPTQRPKPTRRP